ncbi:MAG: aminoacyl-tRNA hydrolase [Verrucomicrobia bacterium]|nr:aminoacyl-tRNA hydrolase [Verrucomicrobiota bacterium]
MPPTAPLLPLRLIVGLGNPGREYDETRHNIGFLVLDRLRERLNLAEWAFRNDWQALWARDAADGGTLFLKPATFMNASGRAVNAALRFYKLAPAETLVIYDDFALPLGRLRLRPDGSAGGHNGMQSVIDHLGTAAVPRLRVGIGAVGNQNTVGHVLGRFRPEERAEVALAVERAVDAVLHARQHGWESAMNAFNRPEPTAPPAK